jgi:hypothetical protein
MNLSLIALVRADLTHGIHPRGDDRKIAPGPERRREKHRQRVASLDFSFMRLPSPAPAVLQSSMGRIRTQKK